MEKAETEELRERVTCGAVLETGGFAVDLKESTRKAVKYRCGDDITIIVIHDGKLEVEGTEIARRRAGPLLSIKIVLALSVLEHFTAMMLSACGKLRPRHLNLIHLCVFCHLVMIVFLAKAMFYITW